MINYLIIAILLAIMGGAAFYIYKARKNGTKCIGCPNSKACSCNCENCQCACGQK